MLIEIKNGETFNGNLVGCDSWMNIHLQEVICTSRDGKRFWQLKECYIRGNTIKSIRVPEEVLEKVKEEQAQYSKNLRAGTSTSSSGAQGDRSSGYVPRGRGGARGGGGGASDRGGRGRPQRPNNPNRGTGQSNEGGAGTGTGAGAGEGHRGGRGGGRGGGSERGGGRGGRGRGGASAGAGAADNASSSTGGK